MLTFKKSEVFLFFLVACSYIFLYFPCPFFLFNGQCTICFATWNHHLFKLPHEGVYICLYHTDKQEIDYKCNLYTVMLLCIPPFLSAWHPHDCCILARDIYRDYNKSWEVNLIQHVQSIVWEVFMLELDPPTALTHQETSGQKTGDGFFGPPALP